MLIKLYVDVFPGCSADGLFFTPRPGEKLPGMTRLTVGIELPDRLINKVDEALPSVTAISEDKLGVDTKIFQCKDCLHYEEDYILSKFCGKCVACNSKNTEIHYQLANPPEDTRSPFIPPMTVAVEPVYSAPVGERDLAAPAFLPPGPFPFDTYVCEYAKNGKCVLDRSGGDTCPEGIVCGYRESICLFLPVAK